jgi:hypothetical protein
VPVLPDPADTNRILAVGTSLARPFSIPHNQLDTVPALYHRAIGSVSYYAPQFLYTSNHYVE